RQTQGTAVTLNLFQGLFRNKIPVFQTSHFRHLFRFVASSATPRVFRRICLGAEQMTEGLVWKTGILLRNRP
ncbi:MAG: hypothetical protein II077_05410, partial [Treponema sp.]|nr:hypothetical protein [Treponema sp.]